MTTEVAAARAWAALRAGRWDEARDAFRARLESGPDGSSFEGLAQAMWWLDDGSACLDAREAAYRSYRSLGDVMGAARAATSLAYDSLLFGEGEAVAQGWRQRAAELLEAVPESVEHGWLAVREAELALALHADPDLAREAGDRARTIGRRLGDDDLTQVGLAVSGLARTMSGEPDAGMPQLDSAVAAATAGDVADLMWMGKVFCWLIIACQETHDLARADEWCRRVEALCRRQNLDPLFTVCRVQHSSVLLARGTWVQAEHDLTVLVDGAAPSRRHTTVDAMVLLGELRRRQGRTLEAEELLAKAEFDSSAVVSRALIRLGRGEVEQAWGEIRRLMASVPLANRLARARMLLPAVQAALAAGDRDSAEAAAGELRATAALVGTAALSGLAAAATATLDEAREPIAEPGPGHDVVGHWREALRHFHDAHLPFDQAESRLRLAEALWRAHDLSSAEEQLRRATDELESLGAGAALVRAKRLRLDLARARGHRDPAELSAREAQVLALVADGRTDNQIADELVLSPHTVHRHVAHILTKLDQPTRAGAVAHALTHGLLESSGDAQPTR